MSRSLDSLGLRQEVESSGSREGASLELLRREIDEIDAAIHALILRRAELVHEVGRSKKGREESLWQPARELFVLRRLLERHDGAFPAIALVRIWRELMAASLTLQGPFRIALYAPEDRRLYLSMAREHFGVTVTATDHGSVRGTLDEVARKRAALALFPLESADEGRPWWSWLASHRAGLRIVARLPLLCLGDDPEAAEEVFVVAATGGESNGSDRTLIVVESDQVPEPEALRRALLARGVRSTFVSLYQHRDRRGLALVECEGEMTPADSRLSALADARSPHRRRLRILGTYPEPFALVGDPPRNRHPGGALT